MITLKLPYTSGPIETDAALIAACRDGDAQAYGSLVARHRDGIYNFIRHTVGHEADAQDLAQETFVRAYNALHRFRPGAPFEPWIYTIAANLCRSHLRQIKRRPQTSLDHEAVETLHAPGADPAQTAEGIDQGRRIIAAIQTLPVDQRMVIVLRHMRSYSYIRIAEVLDLPVSTVEHRLRAAREALRRLLDDEAPQPVSTAKAARPITPRWGGGRS